MSKPTFDNRNENRINIKTDSTVKLIKELSKLGVFKQKKKPKRRVDTGMEGIKQDNVMVGYTKSLGGPLGPQMRNIAPIQQITAGMPQQQIEDIQRTNAARFAALQGEVDKHRTETQQTIGGVVGAAARKFMQLDSAVSGITNIDSERFRGAQQPGVAQDDGIFIQSTNIEDIPDTTDVPMDQTLNEGGPEIEPEFATSTFAEEEQGIPLTETPVMGGGGMSSLKRSEILAARGLGPLPPNTKNTPTEKMQEYYINFTRAFNVSPNFFITSNRKKMFEEMVRILEK